MTLKPFAAALASLMLLAGGLGSCAAPMDRAAPTVEAPKQTLAEHDPAWDSDPALCGQAGGAIRRVGMMAMPYCVIPMRDAGKVCTDRSDCTGMCIQGDTTKVGSRTTGVCQRENVQFGCFSEVKAGRAQPALCAD